MRSYFKCWVSFDCKSQGKKVRKGAKFDAGVETSAEAHRVVPGGGLAQPRGLLRPSGVGGQDAEGTTLPGVRGLSEVPPHD